MNRYIELATQLYALFKDVAALYLQLRSTTDPAAYQSLLERIEDLSAQIKVVSVKIRSLFVAGEVTSADIEEFHKRNQTVWTDDRPVEVPPAPPADDGPPAPPVDDPPPASSAPYDVWRDERPTTRAGFQLGDHINTRVTAGVLRYICSPKSTGVVDMHGFDYAGDVTE